MDRIEKIALTVREAAAASSIGRTALFKALRQGELIGRKVGRRTLILRADLEKFLRNLPTLRSGRSPGSSDIDAMS